MIQLIYQVQNAHKMRFDRILIFLIFFVISNKLFALKNVKISLNCDVRPFNDLHLFNYFLKQQIKQNPPLSSDDLTKKFFELRGHVNLDMLEAECDKKSVAQLALIKTKSKNNKYELIASDINRRSQKNRKEISQRMSLEFVNALLLGKILGLNLGMISSIIFGKSLRSGQAGSGATTAAPDDGTTGGDDSGSDSGSGDDSGGGEDNGRYTNYEDSFSHRFDAGEDEDCEKDQKNESPVESLNDDGDHYSNHKMKYDKKRHKRELYVNNNHKHSPSIRQFLSSVEDNEDLWSSSGTSLYIPNFKRMTPDITRNTAIQDHMSATDRKKSPTTYPSYSTLSNGQGVPFLAPSSFAFSQIPITFRSKVSTNRPSISSLFKAKNKPTLNLKANEQNYLTERKSNLPNFYSISYDQINMDNLANMHGAADYLDGSNNRKEEIDLEHKQRTRKQSEYFDEEMFDDEKPDTKEFKPDEFIRNFDENFDKEFKPKRSTSKKRKNHLSSKRTDNWEQNNGSTGKKKIDLSQLEREDEDDRREGKLIRITRQITMYNKNLFEDQFHMSTGMNEKLVEDDDKLSSGDDLLSSENEDRPANSKDKNSSKKEENKKDLPKLKRKRRVRKRMKGKKRNSKAAKKRKKHKKRTAISPSKRSSNGGKRKGGQKKKKSNFMSQNDSDSSSVRVSDNFNMISSSSIYDGDS